DLPGERDCLRVRPNLHAEPAAFGADTQIAVAEPSHEIKWLARRLLEREPDGIFLHCFFDGSADLRGRSEESICRHQALERLVCAVKIVALHEEADAAEAVGKIGEDGPREKLIPQCFPETLDLAERLRVLRATLDVLNTVLAKRLLELRLTP